MPAASRHLAAVLALGLLVGLCYVGSLEAGFTLDSRLQLLEDSRIRALTAENLRAIFTQDYQWPATVSGVYRPLTTLSYLFNHAVLGNGERPAGYHVINLLLHWANAVLLYAAVYGLRRDLVLSLGAAALFASHPIATEAVTNLIGRADLLAALSVLAGLLLHVRASASRGRSRALWLAALALCTAAGMLCKENAIAILAVVLLYDLVCARRAAPASYAAIALALLAVFAVRHAVYANLPPPVPTQLTDNPLLGTDLWTARWTALGVIARYGGLLLWPAQLSCDYSYDQIPLAGWHDALPLLAITGVAGILLGAFRLRRSNPALAFLALFMLTALLPTSNLLVRIGSIMAERFLYLPSAGFAACVALGLFALLPRRPAAALLALLVAAAGLRTVDRNRDWHDDVSLWSSAVSASPDSFKTHHGLAYALFGDGDPSAAELDAAIREAETAARILEAGDLPSDAAPSAVWLNLGLYYQTKSGSAAPPDWDEKALGAFDRARRLRPEDVPTWLRVARLQRETGRLGDAAVTGLQALALAPGDQGARALLVAIYGQADPGGCALASAPGGRQPDPACPRVRADLCAAHTGLAEIFRAARRDPGPWLRAARGSCAGLSP